MCNLKYFEILEFVKIQLVEKRPDPPVIAPVATYKSEAGYCASLSGPYESPFCMRREEVWCLINDSLAHQLAFDGHFGFGFSVSTSQTVNPAFRWDMSGTYRSALT